MELLDALKMNQFRCSTDNSLRTLPLSRDGLTEHIKRAFSRVVMNGKYQLRMCILLTKYIGVGDSLVIDTFQNVMTPVIQLTLAI